MKVICVIPAYNEAERLGPVLAGVAPRVDSVVVVDDGSSDRTAEIAAAAGVKCLIHPINRGQGAALKTGTIYALKQGAGVIVHFDADGQFRAEEIKKMIEPILAGRVQVVLGSRFLDRSNSGGIPRFKSRVIIPLARLFNRFFLGVKLTDPQSGFRALSAAATEKLDWRQDGMAHCSEILSLLARSGLPFEEVPITVVYHRFGQRLGGGIKIIRDLFIARLIN